MTNKKTQVISIVGAGGKTSLLYVLADMFLRGSGNLRLFGLEPVRIHEGSEAPVKRETVARSPKVLVTTSTKIQVPEHCGWCADASACEAEWSAGHYAVAGTLTEAALAGTELSASEESAEGQGKESPSKADPPVRKLGPLPEAEFQKALAAADVVLIEADGAKHLPLKIPAAHEPVIRPETTQVLGVAGLSCIGKPFGEVCFRAELADQVPGLPEILPADRVVNAETAAFLLASDQGTRKSAGDRPYLAVLNQCTTPEQKEAGGKILRLLKENSGIRGILTALPLPGAWKKRDRENRGRPAACGKGKTDECRD